MKRLLAAAILTATVLSAPFAAMAQEKHPKELLNVSYDISRELYAQLNPAFQAFWKKQTGQEIEVKQSHAGSSKQARSIIEGLPADVVTFNQVLDIEALRKAGFVGANWYKTFPNDSSPYYSLPAFVVRKGNPKNIKDWSDLVRPDVKVVIPNPKTSGNGRYSYLAAYGYAFDKTKDETTAKDFAKKFLANVPVFDTGGRAATTTFAEREIGDVLITFETEVHGIVKEYGAAKVEVVTPSVSLLAEFPVAVVDKVVDQKGSRQAATSYLSFLYSPEAQEILAKNFNRVRDQKVAAKYAGQFPNVRLLTVEKDFGGWEKVQQNHFAEGGILDQVFTKR